MGNLCILIKSSLLLMTNDKIITEIQITVRNIEKEIAEIKSSIKSDYQTKEGFLRNKECIEDIEERVVKIEGNLSKVVWIVLTAVISAILYLVLKS